MDHPHETDRVPPPGTANAKSPMRSIVFGSGPIPKVALRLAVIGGREFEGCILALGGDVAFVSLEMPLRW